MRLAASLASLARQSLALIFVVLLLAVAQVAMADDAVDQELAPWRPGTLDIHQISSGRGNAGLYILPDGTTLLVDAGELAKKTLKHTPDRPDDSRPAGEWIARYVRHALRHTRRVLQNRQDTSKFIILVSRFRSSPHLAARS